MFARGDERAGTGYSLPFGLKNLQTSRWSARIFISREANTPLLPSRGEFIERTNFKLRLYALKKYRLMTLNDRHIKNSSFTPSPAHTALKKVAKVIAVALGVVVGLLGWAILRPIFRGVGWLISILTMTAIIYWLMTL